MKKINPIIIIVFLLFNCSKKENDKLSDKFNNCFEHKLKELSLNDIWIPKGKTFTGLEIYERYEKYLVKKKLLRSIEKRSYVELINNINPGISNEFSKKMEFNTIGFFPSWMVLSCLDELNRKNEILKTNWQFEYAKLIASYQADGNYEHLKNAISLIPNSEFNKSFYRYEVLNIIYILNYKQE